MGGADYLVAFEFHDDVVFLNASASLAEFFQVKTSKSAKPRKLADLTHRKSKDSNSILGKMFKNFTGIWSKHSVQVVLVSNVAFEFADHDLAAAEIDQKYRQKMIDKLVVELPDFVQEQVNNLHFMITGVSIEAMQSYLHGEAMNLFHSRFGEGHGYNVLSWVRLLQSEISRKNNFSSEAITNVNELISKKCIAKNFVDDSLSLLASRARPHLDASLVNFELSRSGWEATDIMRLNKRLSTAAADYTDSTNLEASDLVKRLEENFEAAPEVKLSDFIAEAERAILPTLSVPYRERFYLAAMCVWVFYEKI